MRILVDPTSLAAVGQSLEADVSAPLIGLSAVSNSVGSELESAVDPSIVGAVDHFCTTLLQALQNGGLIAGLLGRGLTGGAGAYALTDSDAVPLTGGAPAGPGGVGVAHPGR
jgi:hypothetical protein